jgi:hypothetical protein
MWGCLYARGLRRYAKLQTVYALTEMLLELELEDSVV